jgi:DNA-binding CsgD family transcriptional regulator
VRRSVAPRPDAAFTANDVTCPLRLSVYAPLLEDADVLRYKRPLDLLEAAYRLDGTDDDWVRGLQESAAKVFAPEGLGSLAYLFTGQVRPDGVTVLDELTTTHAKGRGISPTWRSLVGLFPTIALEMQERLFFSGAVADTWSGATGLGPELTRHPQWTDRSGFDTSLTNDTLGLVCHCGPLGGAVIGVPLRETQPLDDCERRLWRRIAVHVGTALRLRHGVGPVWERAQAVLSPNGRVHHVESPADAPVIQDGLARRRRARTKDMSPSAALDVWQGLLDGRWSLVDHVDTDGKAFVLAVLNEPGSDVTSSLTDRQRSAVALAALGYNNKQIGYALGLTGTAVGMLLRRARLATQVGSRAQLVRVFKRSLASAE